MNPDDKIFVNPNQETLDRYAIIKDSGVKFRSRRQPDWVENYLLYRDKPQINRLTQRQSVNIPLMKSTVKTLLKDIDDAPMLWFSNLDNKDQPELYYNEQWKYSAQRNKIVLKDIVDKRQVLLSGRSFKALNIVMGEFFTEIVPCDDMIVDRYVDPTDIDSARAVIREHIFVPLASLRTNPKLDNAAVRRMQQFAETEDGLIKMEENQRDWQEKQEALAGLGDEQAFNPVLGEAYIELNEFFVKEFNETNMADEIIYTIVAEDMEVLYSAPLEECIGTTEDNFWRNHFPFTTWGDETERIDFWSDGVCDAIRTLNKIANAYFSQKVENRTLLSYGMNYYNSSMGDEGFQPQTFEPVPWGMYPIPVPEGKNIGDVFMNIPIPALDDVIPDLEFLLSIAERVSSATATQEGVKQEGQVTLGEVQLQLANAKERVLAMAVYYNASWEDFGIKYTKMLEGAAHMLNPVKIHKKGRFTKRNYSKIITPEMWSTKQGYKVEVRMKEDVQAKTADSLQKLNYSKSLMPTNIALDGIIKMKSLEFAELDTAEIEEVMKEDELAMKQQAMMAQQGGMMGQQTGQPQTQQPQQQQQVAPPMAQA